VLTGAPGGAILRVMPPLVEKKHAGT